MRVGLNYLQCLVWHEFMLPCRGNGYEGRLGFQLVSQQDRLLLLLGWGLQGLLGVMEDGPEGLGWGVQQPPCREEGLQMGGVREGKVGQVGLQGDRVVIHVGHVGKNGAILEFTWAQLWLRGWVGLRLSLGALYSEGLGVSSSHEPLVAVGGQGGLAGWQEGAGISRGLGEGARDGLRGEAPLLLFQ